jgi:hypothetical protein
LPSTLRTGSAAQSKSTSSRALMLILGSSKFGSPLSKLGNSE